MDPRERLMTAPHYSAGWFAPAFLAVVTPAQLEAGRTSTLATLGPYVRVQPQPDGSFVIVCRKGGVDRRHVGRIEIMANETRFEVARAAATHFRKASSKPDKKDPNLKITQLEATPKPAGQRDERS